MMSIPALDVLAKDDPECANVLRKLTHSQSGYAVGRALEVLEEAQKKGIRPHELARAIAMLGGMIAVGALAVTRFTSPSQHSTVALVAVGLILTLTLIAFPRIRGQMQRQRQIRDAVRDVVLAIAAHPEFVPKPIPDSARAELRKMLTGVPVPPDLLLMTRKEIPTTYRKEEQSVDKDRR